MIVFVAHKYVGKEENYIRARQTTKYLQSVDAKNTYICPLMAFAHMGDPDREDVAEMRLDLLSVCDAICVASDIDGDTMRQEVDLAALIGMEVVPYDKTG